MTTGTRARRVILGAGPFLVALLLTCSPARAATLASSGGLGATVGRGTLQGRVLDGVSERPISAATVTLVLSGVRRVTDAAGIFTFGDRDVLGPDTLVVEHFGYEALRIYVGPDDLGPLDLELLLTPEPVPLEGLTARVDRTAQREAAYLAKIGNGWLWERESFQPFVTSAESVLDPLRWSGKVANIAEGRDGERCVILRQRHPCALVFINNVRTSQDAVIAYAPEDVESYVIFSPIEAPTLYGTGAGGGVIVIYLKGRR